VGYIEASKKKVYNAFGQNQLLSWGFTKFDSKDQYILPHRQTTFWMGFYIMTSMHLINLQLWLHTKINGKLTCLVRCTVLGR
jgi:hypothetical protein